jgi:hypothetical protein
MDLPKSGKCWKHIRRSVDLIVRITRYLLKQSDEAVTLPCKPPGTRWLPGFMCFFWQVKVLNFILTSTFKNRRGVLLVNAIFCFTNFKCARSLSYRSACTHARIQPPPTHTQARYVLQFCFFCDGRILVRFTTSLMQWFPKYSPPPLIVGGLSCWRVRSVFCENYVAKLNRI